MAPPTRITNIKLVEVLLETTTSPWDSIDKAIARCCMNGIFGFVCGCCSDLRYHDLSFEGLVKFLGLLLSLAFLTKGIHEFAIFLSEAILFGLRCYLRYLLSVGGLGER